MDLAKIQSVAVLQAVIEQRNAAQNLHADTLGELAVQKSLVESLTKRVAELEEKLTPGL